MTIQQVQIGTRIANSITVILFLIAVWFFATGCASSKVPPKALFTPQTKPDIVRVAKPVAAAAKSADQLSTRLISTKDQVDALRVTVLDLKNTALVKQVDDISKSFESLQLYTTQIKDQLRIAEIEIGSLRSEIDFEHSGKLQAQEAYTQTYEQLRKAHDEVIKLKVERDRWRKWFFWTAGSLVALLLALAAGFYFRIIRFLF
jgi:TolA-binding protein